MVSAILEAIMAKDSEILKAAAKATEPTSQDNPSQDDQRQQLLEADMLAAEEAAAAFSPYFDAVMTSAAHPAFRLGAAAKFKSMKNVSI